MKILKYIILLSIYFISPHLIYSQINDSTTTDEIKMLMEEVIVTATKTKRHLGSSTVPVLLLKESDIEKTNALRMSQLLSEQAGLHTVSTALGTGVQLQGLDSDYSLIMVDGVPIIGRLNGIVDLSRLTVENIAQIEVVKGPSSVLFGSNAIAGVINIITKSPQNNKSLDVNIKTSSFNTRSYTIGSTFSNKKYKGTISANYYSTGGYNLASNYQGYNISTDYYGKTVSPHANYSFSTNNQFDFSKKITANINCRLFNEKVQYEFLNTEAALIDGRGYLSDLAVRPWINYQVSPRFKSKISYSYNIYKTHSTEKYGLDSLFNTSFFNESYSVVEMQNDYKINNKNEFTLGGGFENEGVQTNRLSDTQVKKANNKYLYFQYIFKYKNKLDLILGSRMENHKNYLSQINPKLSFKLQVTPKTALRASVGRGFKKPDFKQLYFNYTNNAIGYTVLGTTYVEEGIQQLLEKNEIAFDPQTGSPIIYDLYNKILENGGVIDAESSTGINIGVSTQWIDKTLIEVNLFRNDLKNLIETTPIALKSNGWQAYSYQNINRVFTQGVEIEVKYFPNNKITLTSGYQFLMAKDKKIVEAINSGQVFGTDSETGTSYKLIASDYGGLLNRPRHSATLKFFIRDLWRGLDANCRLIYNGKFGFADLNNNQILDIEKEYVSSYFLFNTFLSYKIVNEKIKINMGVDNVFDYTYATPEFTISSLPGRIYYLSLIFKLNQK